MKRKPTPKTSKAPGTTSNLEQIAKIREVLPLAWRASYLAYMIVKPVQIAITEKYNLSWLEWRTILTIGNVPGISANQLVASWGFEKMAASRGIRNLLERKLIRKETDSKDSRRYPLFLAAKGEDVFYSMWPGAKRHYASICSTIDASEFEMFCKITDKMIAQAEVVYQETVAHRHAGIPKGKAKRRSARVARK